MKHRIFPAILIDLCLLAISFLFVTWLKPSMKSYYSETYLIGLGILVIIWFTVSIIMNKFKLTNPYRFGSITSNVLYINFLILAIITILMYGFRSVGFSRFIVFGTIFTATFLEIIAGNLHNLFLVNGNGTLIKPTNRKKQTQISESEVLLKARHDITIRDISLSEIQLRKYITEECGKEAYEYISNQIDLLNPHNLVISTTTRFNIVYQPDNYLQGIVNLKRVNDIRYINKFFETVNKKLPFGGIFLGCVETKELRKKRILKKYIPPFNWIYYFFDFIIKRVFPKFNITKNIYFFLTRGQNRVLSRAETLGRLYSCGFEVTKEDYISNYYFFVAKKTNAPTYDLKPTYGPLVRLRRIGKDGNIIRVYKMRTMHPFSEYLQEYIHNKHALQEGGKFNNDFRISTVGKIMRMFWIDELPMLINWFRKEVKLVGVRPISEHYFKLYSKEHQERRIKYKPGLIPPYYADLPKTLEEIEASEKQYLDAYDLRPFRTNWKYFWKALYNIIFKKARSK